MLVIDQPIKLTPELIYGFTGSLLSGRFDEPAPTPDCHLEWWGLCCSDEKRVAIAAPRGHAKSTAISKSYALAAALFRDSQFIVIISDTYKQATNFLGEIKRELSSNDLLRSAFGVKEFLTDREDEIVVLMEDGYEFKFLAIGSEQKIRGLIWNGKRPDLIIGDDLENDEIVMNPDRREKFRNWIFNAVLPAMSKKGRIRIVGTILHMDSMLERFMPKDNDENSVHYDLKVEMKNPKNGWRGVRYRAHDEDFKKILWPIKWDEKRFRELRSMFRAQGNPEGYYQEYLNRPIDPSHTFFKKDDFTEFEELDYKRDWAYAPTYCSTDLAVSDKTRRDFSAIGIASTNESNQLCLRHVTRDRMDSKEIVDVIIRLYRQFKFSVLLIGKGTIEKSIGPFLKERMAQENIYFHIEAIPELEDKRLRAQSIRGRMRSGGVKFNKRTSWYPEFEQELLEFDRGTHDDQVDFMSLFGMYLDKLVAAPTRRDISDLEFEEEQDFYRSFGMEDEGRNQTTGY